MKRKRTAEAPKRSRRQSPKEAQNGAAKRTRAGGRANAGERKRGGTTAKSTPTGEEGRSPQSESTVQETDQQGDILSMQTEMTKVEAVMPAAIINAEAESDNDAGGQVGTTLPEGNEAERRGDNSMSASVTEDQLQPKPKPVPSHERPTCCCGCGGTLSSPKKHFLQGHDGRAKAIVRHVIRGDKPVSDIPAELLERYREVNFIMDRSDFRTAFERWSKSPASVE